MPSDVLSSAVRVVVHKDAAAAAPGSAEAPSPNLNPNPNPNPHPTPNPNPHPNPNPNPHPNPSPDANPKARFTATLRPGAPMSAVGAAVDAANPDARLVEIGVEDVRRLCKWLGSSEKVPDHGQGLG